MVYNMTNAFTSAKSIVDFYMEQLTNDAENPNAHFALQYANLKLLKLRTESMLDALESYEIEVQ